MQISEIFYSIQGEGVTIGTPSIFIRLAGCHLRCTWCDSKFTWPLHSKWQLNPKQLFKEISQYPCRNLVITGGEPLIQQDELKVFLEIVKNNNYRTEMETSGSIQTKLGRLIDQYNCSPKLSNSGNKPYQLKKFPKKRTWYKFVVDNKEELREIMDYCNKNGIAKDRIILMPQGITKEEISKKLLWLAEICKENNLKLTTRLHVEIWGNKRGV